jgi:hypothetical protein
MSLQRVHLRINDVATGQPTPVRLRVTDVVGNYYAPFGHAAEFPTGVGEDVGGNVLIGRDRWAYIDGACEIAVPAGELLIEATKGPEYRPLREQLHLPPGKLALRFAIERWIDLREGGWHSGDIRCHFIAPHVALLEAAAEDLAVVNLLVRESPLLAIDGQSYLSNSNLAAFSGQRPCIESDGHLVAVNTFNTHPVLGKLGLLHCHRTIYPLAFGGPDHTDDWSLADWCGQCHRKHGLVVWADAFNPKAGHFGEALANLVLGDIDAVEFNPDTPGRLGTWIQLLDAGVRASIVGGSGKDSNRTLLGAFRTYARLRPSESLSYGAWIDAVTDGRTFMTSGPLISFQVDGEYEGAIHKLTSGATRLRARFSVRSMEPIDRVELLVNGAIAATGNGQEHELDVDMPSGGWLAVRCWQRGHLVALTSPQYVEVEDVPAPRDPAAVRFLDGHLQRTRDWIVAEGRFDKPASRDRLLSIVDAAREVLATPPKNASPKRREPNGSLQ